MKKLMQVAAVVISLAVAGAAYAVPYGFVGVKANEQDLTGQLWVDVNPVGSAGVSFTFYNEGAIPSVITSIYFDDGFLVSPVVTNGPGTNFLLDASPKNFPEGNSLTPAFDTTFSAGAVPPPTGNGVNNSVPPNREWVMVSFTLSGGTFDDVLAAIGEGIRVGIHVQSIGTSNGSDSYVTDGGGRPHEPVPEPTTVLLLGSGLLGLGLMRRRKR